jgi:hypothetical protein
MCMNSFPTETLPLGLPPDTLGIKFPTHTFGATFKLQWGGGQRKGGGRAAFLSGGSRGECLLAFCSFWSCPLPGLVTSAFIFEARGQVEALSCCHLYGSHQLQSGPTFTSSEMTLGALVCPGLSSHFKVREAATLAMKLYIVTGFKD